MVELVGRVPIENFLNAINDVPIAALNIASKRIVKGHGSSECADLGIGQNGLAGQTTPTLNENILRAGLVWRFGM